MSSAQTDYYATLEVTRDCDGATLKSAYRKLAMKFHPDRNPGDAGAEAKFKAISEAYDCLKDPQKRAAYDRYGHEAFTQGMNGGGGGPFGGGAGRGDFADIGDIFETIFGSAFGGGGQRQPNRRGADLRYDMQVTLEEAFHGKSTEIEIEVSQACDTCDGSGATPWHESDETHPLNVYGRSKLAGERAVHQGCARHLLFRTSWVCSPRAGGFADAVLRQALDGKPLSVVSDQVGAPTTAALVAEVTCGVLRQVLDRADDGLAGCYHLAAAGGVSRLGYARHVLARAQAAGLPLRTGPEQVAAVVSADFPSPARRPLNSRLDTSLLRARFGLILPPWHEGVDQVVDALTASWRSASR